VAAGGSDVVVVVVVGSGVVVVVVVGAAADVVVVVVVGAAAGVVVVVVVGALDVVVVVVGALDVVVVVVGALGVVVVVLEVVVVVFLVVVLLAALEGFRKLVRELRILRRGRLLSCCGGGCRFLCCGCRTHLEKAPLLQVDGRKLGISPLCDREISHAQIGGGSKSTWQSHGSEQNEWIELHDEDQM